MAESDFLRRIDAEVARTNVLIEEDRRQREAAMAGHAAGLDDVRVALGQMSLRGERLAHGYLRRLEEMSEESRADATADRAAIRDLSEQIRANTRALLTLLDERGGGPAPA